MTDRVIMASRFKAECLAILDQVEALKVSVTVTKHGRPVARLVPLEAAVEALPARSIRLVAEDDEAYFTTGEQWSADPDPA
ncbi:MAG TPA: type II toxin-antitoxin system prevent-host-death family antitoxin [Candidatus Sulfomarinibacteraceae bacterium]|nr:type II toxin-antitoxin system prevent-host-death family antitoxin [Candidatus Sulfomarinibacteraceae bacterium]